ncbi:MAG: hypothetical protein M3077_09120 [Candidatus Dormibacteraeota bacterium]|nr:hypothetical protein [Candidatus Dormibacteraeota bacterium]
MSFALAVVAISLLPYLLAYVKAPPGHHFAGFFFIADDATTYLAKMRQGAAGSWTWNDPYTSEAHGGVFLFSFYLFFGHLAALLHIPLIAAYHLARISGGIALVLAVDRLGRHLLEPGLRHLALTLVVLGSGLGLIAQVLGNPSVLGHQLEALDLHLPELTGFYSILAIPHFAWATALIVLALVGLLRLAERPAFGVVLVTGLTMTALTAIHPQMIPVLGLVWVAYRAVLIAWGARPHWQSLLAEAAAFAITVPLLAYNAWILYRDPTIAEWARQWRHQPPGSLSLALSLGLPLIAAVIGTAVVWRRRDRVLALVMVWPPLVVALLYLPNVANIQRRLLDAIYVPLGILAAVGLRALAGRLRPARARRLERLLLPGFCFSSAIVLAIALRFGSGAFPEAYVGNDTWQAMEWLSTHHRSDDRALSSPQAGLLMPAFAGVPVYVGHYSETLNYFDKLRAVGQLLQPGLPDSTVEAFFLQNHLTLLYWGPDEAHATGFDPQAHAYLRPIYQQGTVAIYRLVVR